jgi:hypothetical protein
MKYVVESTVGWLTGGLFVITMLSGCASPGVPQPPSLKLPKPAKDVTADRVGNEVTLRWTTPSETTDGQTIKKPITAVICREETARGKAPVTCTPVNKQVVKPGHSEAKVQLQGVLAADPVRLVRYRVELQNDKGRAVDKSGFALVAAGMAPAAVEGLRITSKREGALLRWQSQPNDAPVEVRRILVDPPSATEKPAPNKTSFDLSDKSKAPSAEVILRAGDSSTDSGGMLDHEVVRQMSYRYTAQRVRQVTLGGHELVIRGPQSTPITWAMKDTFPPAAPMGLVAIPGDTSISLSWEAGTESDLTGYIVYRSDNGNPEKRLNADPVSGPAFEDKTAAAGTTYTYRVTAIDESGNESKPSASVRETTQR